MHTNVFHARKKPLWQSALGSLALAALMLSLMLAGAFLDLAGVLFIVMIVFFFLFLLVGLMLLPYAYLPMELRVNDNGMETVAGGKTTRIPWSRLEQVRVVPDPVHGKTEWLMAWPEHAPMQLRRRLYHPEWKPEHAAVKVCDLSAYKAAPEEIKATIRRAAGPTWTNSPTLP